MSKFKHVLKQDLFSYMTAAQKSVLTGICLVIGALALLTYNAKWVVSIMRDPLPVTSDQISQLASPSSLRSQWVSLKFGKALDSGIELTGMQDAKFILVQTGAQWLLVEVPIDFSGNSVVGYLEDEPNKFTANMIEEIKDRMQGYKIASLYLYANTGMRQNAFAVLGVSAFLFLLGIFVLVGEWKRAGRTEAK